MYSLYFVTRPVLPQLRLSCQLHSSVAAVNSAILVAGNVLEIVPLDPVVHDVLGDVVDDLDLLSEQDRQSTLVGVSLVPLSPVSQERLRGREIAGLYECPLHVAL